MIIILQIQVFWFKGYLMPDPFGPKKARSNKHKREDNREDCFNKE